MNAQLGVILTAMVTPFDERGELDIREAGRLARWLVERGNDGLIVAGSTGEGQTLDAGERVALFKAVKEAVGHDAFVIANAGTNATRESVDAAARGYGGGRRCDSWRSCRTTTSRRRAECWRISERSRKQRISRSSSTTFPDARRRIMLPETLLELARRHPNIAGVKESSGDLKQIGMILRDRDAGFIVWAGDDHLFLPCLAMGADGVVGVASHLCSREYRAMVDAYRNGRRTRRRRFIYRSCRSSMRSLQRPARSR